MLLNSRCLFIIFMPINMASIKKVISKIDRQIFSRQKFILQLIQEVGMKTLH